MYSAEEPTLCSRRCLWQYAVNISFYFIILVTYFRRYQGNELKCLLQHWWRIPSSSRDLLRHVGLYMLMDVQRRRVWLSLIWRSSLSAGFSTSQTRPSSSPDHAVSSALPLLSVFVDPPNTTFMTRFHRDETHWEYRDSHDTAWPLLMQ